MIKRAKGLEPDLRDDLCEACQKQTANHETDFGVLCDECYLQVFPHGGYTYEDSKK